MVLDEVVLPCPKKLRSVAGNDAGIRGSEYEVWITGSGLGSVLSRTGLVLSGSSNNAKGTAASELIKSGAELSG